MPYNPGVYRMLDLNNEILYIGKAKNLPKRVGSYFTRSLSLRIQSMVSQIENIEFTITTTEAEALLLESNLIKQHLPKYNILLRDDKGYPFIYASTQQPYPGLAFHRGSKRKKGSYYGPYTSAAAVRSTLDLIQKVFRVRQCNDSYFKNRARPCLEFQIKRCSGPCTNEIDQGSYRQDVEDSISFLQGKSEYLIKKRVQLMEQASAELDFEKAAKVRDQISLLRKISDQQYVSGGNGDSDVIYCLFEAGVACVQLFSIRGGNSLGNRSYFPRVPDKETTEAEILRAFIMQYYSKRVPPAALITSHVPEDKGIIEEILQKRREKKVKIQANPRGSRLRWLRMAKKNAAVHLHNRLNTRAGQQLKLSELKASLNLKKLPQHIECFDISHMGGEATVASCVVFKQAVSSNQEYRRFNITGITPGDDYAAMEQAIHRRYLRLLNEEKPLPELLLIDGGKGQLSVAEKVLKELKIDTITLLGVAKGSERKAGLETLFLISRLTTRLTPENQSNTASDSEILVLPANSSALLLIQQIRDEAHRFAITGHRKKREYSRTQSNLETIPGLGAKRRQALLKYFGGLQGIKSASAEELAKVSGISADMATKITDLYHQDL